MEDNHLHGSCDQALPKRMPADWTPQVNGYSAGFAPEITEFIVAIYGRQGAATGRGFGEMAAPAFSDNDGPISVQYGQFVDERGCTNDLAIAYWVEQADFERWQATHPWPLWCQTTPEDGVWREVLRVPVQRGETLLSSPLIEWGLSAARSRLVGPVREHGYWGAMRDRLPVSSQDLLETTGALSSASTDVNGCIRRVVTPTANLCVICSGQDWNSCEPAHAEYYLRELEPKLRTAMADLARNGEAHGSHSCRFVRMTDASGTPLDASFGLAFFRSLSDLERWAATDPLHLDIWRSFISHKRETQTTLRLWHEVLVLPAQGQVFEYLNCHPATGLMSLDGNS
mgnify:CR=1 FL=1